MKLPTPLTISDATGKSWHFERFEVFVRFVKDEEKFWHEKALKQQEVRGFTNQYLAVYSQLGTILTLTKDIKTMLTGNDEPSTRAHIDQFQVSRLNPLSSLWIWSGNSFITTWLDSYKYSQPTGDAFIQAVITKSIPHVTNVDYFKGYLLAYEFELQGESDISKRRDSEHESFSDLKSVLVEQKNNLVSEISDFKRDAENIKNTYIEHMRLKGPAEYWNIRAKECGEQGKRWAGLLGLAIIVAGFIFVSLMSAWLHSYSIGLKLNTFEGAVIFAAIISLFAFAIKTLSKLTFSAFHLQRDAEEREQLTHLYLALSNESKVDADSRNIVLQALFSRSDSGLLVGDHSPAMPSIQDAIRATGKNY